MCHPIQSNPMPEAPKVSSVQICLSSNCRYFIYTITSSYSMFADMVKVLFALHCRSGESGDNLLVCTSHKVIICFSVDYSIVKPKPNPQLQPKPQQQCECPSRYGALNV